MSLTGDGDSDGKASATANQMDKISTDSEQKISIAELLENAAPSSVADEKSSRSPPSKPSRSPPSQRKAADRDGASSPSFDDAVAIAARKQQAMNDSANNGSPGQLASIAEPRHTSGSLASVARPHHIPKLDSLSKKLDDIKRNLGDGVSASFL